MVVLLIKTYQVIRVPGTTGLRPWGIIATYAEKAEGLLQAMFPTEAEAQVEADRLTRSARGDSQAQALSLGGSNRAIPPIS